MPKFCCSPKLTNCQSSLSFSRPPSSSLSRRATSAKTNINQMLRSSWIMFWINTFVCLNLEKDYFWSEQGKLKFSEILRGAEYWKFKKLEPFEQQTSPSLVLVERHCFLDYILKSWQKLSTIQMVVWIADHSTIRQIWIPDYSIIQIPLQSKKCHW